MQIIFTERSSKVRAAVINGLFNNNFSKNYDGLRSKLVIKKWQQEIFCTIFTT